MSKRFKKVYCFAAIMLIMALMLNGCGSGKSDTDKSSANSTQVSTQVSTQASASTSAPQIKDCTIKFYTESAVNKTEIDGSLAEFNKVYPQIKVETVVITDSDAANKIKTAIVAGEQVDVISSDDLNFDKSTAEKLYLPLDDYLKQNGIDRDQEFGNYYKPFVENDKLYGVPKYLAPCAVVFNKNYLDAAKIPYPTADWTWDDFFAMAKQLTTKDMFGAFEWKMNPTQYSSAVNYLASYGGWEIVKEDGSPNIDSPVLKKAADMLYQATMVDKSIPSLSDVTANKYSFLDIFKHKWAMMSTGLVFPIFIDTYRAQGNIDDADYNSDAYVTTYMPKWDKSSVAKPSVDNIHCDIITQNTKNPDAAFAFVKWHIKDCLLAASKFAHRIPTSRTIDVNSLMTNWTFYQDPKTKEIVQGKGNTDKYKIVVDPEIKSIQPVYSHNYTYVKQLNDELAKNLTILFSGEGTVDEALSKAKADCEKVYESEKGK